MAKNLASVCLYLENLREAEFKSSTAVRLCHGNC